MSQSEILLESGTNELEIIEFYIDEQGPDGGQGERSFFGINVAKALEVIENPGLDVSPYAPHPCFLGTIPLREIILPVLDLSVWLGLKRRKSANEVILVTQFNRRTTGFLASGVTQIHRVAWTQVSPPHRYLNDLPDNCVTGLVELEGRFVQLLDLEKIIFEFDPSFEGAPGGRAKTTYRAMVADDSGMMRHMLKERLEAANFELLMAGNGQEAWDLLQRRLEETRRAGRPLSDVAHIVVSDIEMPTMDGYALTKKIKEHEVLKDLPVILFSSLITEDQRHKGQSVGANAQISKPEFGRLADMAIELIEKSS